MSDPRIREAVVEALRRSGGALRTSELIDCLPEFNPDNDPTNDVIKAAIWDLAEMRVVCWDPEGRIALVAEVARA